MKIMNILILVIAVSSLLIMSNAPVAAADETKTIIDAEDDVLDYMTGETSSDYPNVDITRLIYVKEGKNVTLTLEVKGVIENLGDIDNPLGDLITYGFTLITSADSYYIIYISELCMLESSTMSENITTYTIDGSSFEVRFNVSDADETYDSVTADTAYMEIGATEDDIHYLIDLAADEPLQVFADIPNLGETGKDIDFIGFSDFGKFPYTYLWDFGDGSTSDEKTPSHIYNKAGTYNVTFTVTDDEGSEESDAGMIEIVGDDDNDTPGFELIIAITAIGLIFLWKRKR